MLPFLEAILFSLREEISFGRAKVDNLGAAVAIFLLLGALLAVVGVRDARPAADDASTLVE